MSKYEKFENEVQEVEYFITNQWELFKNQAEEILRNFSKNQKELSDLRDFFDQKLKNRVGGITANAFEIAFEQIQEEDWE